MQIHIAYENIDAVLELVPTHRLQKQYRITPQGERAVYQRWIKFDSTLSDEKLLRLEHLVDKLKDSNIDVDIELAGKKIHSTSRITVSEDLEPVYNYSMYDVLTLPDGTVKERPHMQTFGNINTSIPVRITDDLEDPKELMLEYVFRKSYYIIHYDGVTYKFLYEIAERLHQAKKFSRVDTFNLETKKREPLILNDGGRKFPRAYLSGMTKGKKYRLALYLSDQELKVTIGA
ncbi:MAG: hypothetical protein ACFFG0_13100 [Candidatus Thorarchaeota archaeon]